MCTLSILMVCTTSRMPKDYSHFRSTLFKEDGTDIWPSTCGRYWKEVPNFSPPIQCHISDCRGILCSSGVVPTGHLRTLCHNSFRNRAATLFNCLPKHIRNIVNCTNTIMFKRALDNHLCSIEDSPMVPNECNSLNSRSKEKTMTDRWRATIADQAE